MNAKTLTTTQIETIQNHLYGLIHSNGYREGQGELWVAPKVYEILDILGMDPAEVFAAEEDTRSGCMETVCWCHVDPQAEGFACNSCGCMVEGVER